jgi:ribulose-phosphate 3-epimerase
MNKIIIAASILSADFSKLGEQIKLAEQAGVDWIHVDVMDGHFVPNISMGPFVVEWCRKMTDLPIDVHLMIENPERHIDAFAKAGASSISVHIESNPNIRRTIDAIRSLGTKPGVVINPGTSAGSIDAVLTSVDYVLVMTVNPGYSGQVFLPDSPQKISELSNLIAEKKPSVFIQVDGGITTDNIATIFQAGARCFVAATAIFKYPQGIAAGISSLRKAVQ